MNYHYYCLLFIFSLIPTAITDLHGCEPGSGSEFKIAQEVTSTGPFRFKYKRFLPLYDISLIVPMGIEPGEVFSGMHPFSLNFTYLRRIKKAIIIKSANITLNKNLNLQAFPKLENQVAGLHEKYVTVNKKDQAKFLYCPNHGTDFLLNGQLIHTIPGKQFAELYFKVWFGEHPISSKIKGKLLNFSNK